MKPEQIPEAIQNERIIFVMGDRDTGKTMLVTHLANELFRQGFSVGVIDADIGQSDIGPPTTIGFGIVQAPLNTLRDVVLQSLYFVGAISPKGHLLPLVIGTRKMLDKALSQGVQKILIDTTGLVKGQLGRTLKQYKLELAAPDVIVCLQRTHECEPILKAYKALAKPSIFRLPSNTHCRAKTPSERQTNRAKLFEGYFAEAQTVQVSLTEPGLFETALFSGEPVSVQQLEQLQDELHKADSSLSTSSAPRLLWGEYLESVLLLITSRKLRHQELMTLKFMLNDVGFIQNSTPENYQNLLVGLLNSQGECSGLGILRSLDFSTQHAAIVTHVSPQKIAALKFSSYKYES